MRDNQSPLRCVRALRLANRAHPPHHVRQPLKGLPDPPRMFVVPGQSVQSRRAHRLCLSLTAASL